MKAKMKLKKKYSTGVGGVQAITSNRFQDKPDTTQLNKQINTIDQREKVGSAVATTALDAVVPGLGTGANALNSVIGSATTDADGVYKSKTAEYIDKTINPFSKIDAIASGDKDIILDAFTFGLAGESKSDKIKKGLELAKEKANQKNELRKYTGQDVTMGQRSTFEKGTKSLGKPKIKKYAAGLASLAGNLGSLLNPESLKGISSMTGGFSNAASGSIGGSGTMPEFAPVMKKGKTFDSTITNSQTGFDKSFDEKTKNIDLSKDPSKTPPSSGLGDMKQDLIGAGTSLLGTIPAMLENDKQKRKMDMQRQGVIYKTGGKVKEQIPIEIEGKKYPEIHTDKNFNLKNLGLKPHTKGGTKVLAEEGDVIFPTQNSKKKFTSVLNNIKNRNIEKLKIERDKLPEDKNSEQYDKGTKKKIKPPTRKLENTLKYAPFTEGKFHFQNLVTGGMGYNEIPDNYNDIYNNRRSPEEFAELPIAWTVDGKTQVSPDTPGAKRVRIGDGKYKDKDSLYLDDVPQPKSPADIPSKKATPIDSPKTEEPKIDLTQKDIPKEKLPNKPKKFKNIPVYLHEANMLAQGLSPTIDPAEKYYTPEVLQYNDTSDPNRRLLKENQSVINSNARNLSGGSAGSVRSNAAKALQEKYAGMEKINNYEANRALDIENQNVGIRNQAQQINLGRFDRYQDNIENRMGVKNNYVNEAIESADQKLRYNEQQKYMKNRDAIADDREQIKMALMENQNYRYNPETRTIDTKPNSAGENKSNVDVTTAHLTEEQKKYLASQNPPKQAKGGVISFKPKRNKFAPTKKNC